MREFDHVTTDATVAIYKASGGVFEGLLSEMRELSKKKPDVTLNKSKVKLLNRVLDDVRAILKDEPEGKYLALLDDDELPQNSDAVLMMVQFEKALASFRKRYKGSIYSYGNSEWITEKNIESWKRTQVLDEEYDEDDEDDE